MPRNTNPKQIVRLSEVISPLRLRVSAEYTPMAMVKLEKIPIAIEQVGHEEAAEEHDFRQQKEPHAEAGSLPLLVHANEMVAQICGMLFVPFVGFRVPGGDCLAIQQSLPRVRSCEPTSHSRTLRDP